MPLCYHCPSLAWPQGAAHPLRNVHYTSIFQAVIGFIVFILAIYSIKNMGWWTGLELAAGLAGEFYLFTARNFCREYILS